MMTQDEYILGLLAIVSGLAVSHMIGALHGILFHRRIVRWDWLMPVTAVLVANLILFSWWISWASFQGRNDAQLIFGWFLIPIAQLTCLFLAARGIFPDFMGDRQIDLRKHYETVSRYVWSALSANLLLTLGSIAAGYFIAGRGPTDAINFPLLIPGVLAALVLAIFRRRIVHAVLVPILLLMTLAGTLTKVL